MLLLESNNGALSAFKFHFITVKAVNGETEFIPNLAKMQRGL